jgi:glycosyltransferase involved in cell wall biosynthesis
MALGCSIVVSNIGGFSEIVTHGETGLTVYPDDAHSVAWGVRQILEQPDLAQQRAAKAHQAVEAFFNWPRIATQTLNTYQRGLAK